MSVGVSEHDMWRERAALYVLDVLEVEERETFEDHLRTCLECGAELLTLRPAVDAMAQAVLQLDPPGQLRDRAMAVVLSEPRRPSPAADTESTPKTTRNMVRPLTVLRWLAMAAMLVVFLGLAYYASALRNRVLRLESELDTSQTQAAALQARVGNAESSLSSTQAELSSASSQLAVLTAPDSRRVMLTSQSGAPSASGRADWSPSRGLVLSVSKLPVLQPMRTYQVWLLMREKPVSAGLLETDANGNRTAVFEPPAVISEPLGVAVSEEPAGGVAQPGDRIYLVGNITRPS